MKHVELYTALLVCILGTSCAHIETQPRHPALRMMEDIQPLEDENNVVPYFLNIAAIYRLEMDRDIPSVRAYLNWYLNHLSYPDKDGFTGTIYNWSISRDGTEQMTDTRDSVDGYAGTFLVLVYRYYQVTRDREFVTANRERLQDIAYTIAYLQDKDGLTKVLPGRTEKYLMDNCEAYGGISAFAALAREMKWDTVTFYEDLRQSLRTAIVRLYNPGRANFDWAVDGTTKYESSWNTFYPDAYAQLFPILFDVLEEDRELERNLWDTFQRLYSRASDKLPPEQRLIYKLTDKAVINTWRR